MDFIENYRNKCRSCLSDCSNNFTVFDKISKISIKEFLRELSLDIKDNELLPEILCENCFHKIHTIYNFINIFKNSQKQLNKLLQNRIAAEDKEEIIIEVETVDDCTIPQNDSNEICSCNSKNHKYVKNSCNYSNPLKYRKTNKSVITTENSYNCSNCDKAFQTKSGLSRHFKSAHGSEQYLCNLCGEEFKGYDSWRYHSLKHSGGTHLCMYCGRTFLQAAHLNYHLWTHTGVRPYQCDKCGKRFVTKFLKSKHLNKMCNALSQ